MKTNRLVIAVMAGLGLASWGVTADAADAAAGKAKFAAACADCHEAGDFEGEDAAALADSLKKIVGGQLKHKEALKLSDKEIADVAAYMASGGK